MIVCEITNRKWPDSYSSALKVCSACGGKIDTMVEAWFDEKNGGQWHSVCWRPKLPPSTITRPGPILVTRRGPTPGEVVNLPPVEIATISGDQ